NMDSIDHIVSLAQDGSLDNIDLRIKDMTRKEILAGNMTAANFGKVSDVASKADLALGIINMVFETVAMMSIFAGRSYGIKDIVLTGNLTVLPQAESTFANLSEMFGVRFRIPEHSRYATVIGAALSYFDTIGALPHE
ncbi:MAG: pantothenate kinase, partial [Eubacteriales bacterium]